LINGYSVESVPVNTLRAAIGLVISLCFLVAFAWLLFREASIRQVQNLNYDVYLSIMLTALGVMIATFAILVGLAAIWGYAGLKDYLREMAVKQVDAAVQDTLKKYPAAADMIDALNQFRQQQEVLDQLRNQAVTVPEPKLVATASKPDIKGVDATPLESIEKQATPIALYPGEEDGHGDSDS
jgi:hypothetical protein